MEIGNPAETRLCKWPCVTAMPQGHSALSITPKLHDIPVRTGTGKAQSAHPLCGVGFSVWGFKSPYVVSPHPGHIPLAVSLSLMLFFRPAPIRREYPPADPCTAHGRRAAKLAAKHKRKLNPSQTIVRVEF